MKKRLPPNAPFAPDISSGENTLPVEWIDGKQIYREIIDLDGLGNLATLIAPGIVDTLIASIGLGDITAEIKTTLPFDNGTLTARTGITIATGEVSLIVTLTQTKGSFVILWYTKK